MNLQATENQPLSNCLTG